MQPAALRGIEGHIYRIRGQQVMLDRDLAQLYGVATKNLNKAVQRNLIRFPSDFMFRLNLQEAMNLRFQFGTSRWGGRRYLPYVFTEEGVAMLSSVLRSKRAAWVNIAIMRAFVKLRHALSVQKELVVKVERLEGKVNLMETDVRFIREDVRKLKNPPEKTGPDVKGFYKE
jgi:hypothetical protein